MSDHEYNDGDPCPACGDRDEDSYIGPGTLQTFEEDRAVPRLSCGECGSIFQANGVCVMNNTTKSVPPWIDRHGEVDPIKKREYEKNDRGQYPDHYYDRNSNRRL